MTSTPGGASLPSPAVSWEELDWETDPARDGLMSRRARMAARGPDRAAVPAEIAELPLAVPADVSAAAEDALLAVSRFDAEASAVLSDQFGSAESQELAPLSAVLLRTESASSSQIEEITAGAKALALATMGERSGPNAAKVAANVDAMLAAGRMAEDLTAPSLLSAHRALMHGQDHAGPGRWRTAPVWIGGRVPTPHTAEFVPPHPRHVEAAIADLVAFCTRTDVPVLVHAAVAHAQFETIHPFADGNGRTGRVLVHALLRRAGAVHRLTVPVSAGLLSDTGSYFRALGEYRAGDCAPIVECFTRASFEGVGLGRELLQRLSAIRSGWDGALSVRRDSVVWRILPQLLAQPAVNVAWVRDRCDVSQPAAQRAIDQLVEAGVLTAVSTGRRNRVWVAAQITQTLDEVVAAARRRR